MEIMSAETSITKNHDAKNQRLPSLCQPYPLPTPWTFGVVGDGKTLICVEGLAWHGGPSSICCVNTLQRGAVITTAYFPRTSTACVKTMAISGLFLAICEIRPCTWLQAYWGPAASSLLKVGEIQCPMHHLGSHWPRDRNFHLNGRSCKRLHS